MGGRRAFGQEEKQISPQIWLFKAPPFWKMMPYLPPWGLLKGITWFHPGQVILVTVWELSL